MRKSFLPCALLFGAAVFAMTRVGTAESPTTPRVYDSAEANRLHVERKSIDEIYARADWPGARIAYAEFIETNKGSTDKEVQDEVGAARIRLGYIETKGDNFGAARQVFLDAKREYKGTGTRSPDFGSIPDQALYQAAVCLVADGKFKAARAEFTKFIQDRPLSPLVHACYRRLKKLNGGIATVEMDSLLQVAISKQEKHNRYESAMCGPKVIEELLRINGQNVGYRKLAQFAGADSRGLTLDQMVNVLQEFGFKCEAMELNAKDFASLTSPTIWLRSDHYVAILESANHKHLVYDPMLNSRQWSAVPAINDAQFRATVLLVRYSQQERNR